MGDRTSLGSSEAAAEDQPGPDGILDEALEAEESPVAITTDSNSEPAPTTADSENEPERQEDEGMMLDTVEVPTPHRCSAQYATLGLYIA